MMFALFPVIALIIKLTSNGPILSRQETVGLKGRIFYRYRFRTVRIVTEGDKECTSVCPDDSRLTKVGRFLRMVRLDELPLILNVLRGEMAFVAPQPERPEIVEEFNRAIPFYGLRYALPPGLTGYAQGFQKFGNTVEDAKERLRYDLFYVKNGSPGFDVLIIFMTIRAVLLGKKREIVS